MRITRGDRDSCRNILNIMFCALGLWGFKPHPLGYPPENRQDGVDYDWDKSIPIEEDGTFDHIAVLLFTACLRP